MSNQPPTLDEMKRFVSDEVTMPSLSDMTHALESEEALAHYGIKGMKWGIRRSDAELGKIRNSRGNVVGELKDQSRSAMRKIKNLRAGDVTIINDGDGPVVVVKLKDGSLKETRMSVDAENVSRTFGKQSHEMSTREMNDAVKRAQAIDAYNRMFNPKDDPNEALRLKADAMELQLRYKQNYLKANPPKPGAIKKLTGLVEEVSPIFSTLKKMDEMSGNHFSKSVKGMFDELKDAQETTRTTKPPREPRKSRKERKRESSGTDYFTRNPEGSNTRTRSNDVYDISSMGRDNRDYTNPYIPELGSGR